VRCTASGRNAGGRRRQARGHWEFYRTQRKQQPSVGVAGRNRPNALERDCVSSSKPRGFNPLAYIARYFDTVEINSSFYGAPRLTGAKKWVDGVKANAQFRFTAKLLQSFTQTRKPGPGDEKDFKDGIAPLIDAELCCAKTPYAMKSPIIAAILANQAAASAHRYS
jgi:Protein of unknown function DUF72